MTFVRRHSLRRSAPLLATAVLGTALAACGAGSAASGTSGGGTIRLGYLPNLTHATALVALDRGYVASALGADGHVQADSFNAGPAEAEALFAGGLDAAYMGPSPAVNAFIKSKGAAVRIVAGEAVGGAALVVRGGSGISGPGDLRGKRIATPQLGNTQDVALRAYLVAHGLRTDPQGGGDVKILPTDNATTLLLFKQGSIDGAWVPEPYASRLVDEDGGRVLVDEATLWPGGRFPTTLLVVRTEFLGAHPDLVRDLISAQLNAQDWMTAHPDQARTAVNDALRRLVQKGLSTRVLDDAFAHVSFTADPVTSALATEVRNAQSVNLLSASADIRGIADLRLLNGILRSRGAPPVDAGSLGQA